MPIFFGRNALLDGKPSALLVAVLWAAVAKAALLAGALAFHVAYSAPSSQPAEALERSLPIQMVVERRESSLELYISGRADLLFDMFDMPHREVADNDGLLQLRDLQSGTWQLGDRLIAGSRFSLGRQEISFEAMSLMLHPIEDRLPLRDSVDGLVAIAVCTAIDGPPRALKLSELQAYVGLHAEVDDSQGQLVLRLAGAAPVELHADVRDFVDGNPIGRYPAGADRLTDLQFGQAAATRPRSPRAY